MFFKILVSISKNDVLDLKVSTVLVVLEISVSVVTAAAGDLVLIFPGFGASLADDLIFLFEADTMLSTCLFDKFLSLVLGNFVH